MLVASTIVGLALIPLVSSIRYMKRSATSWPLARTARLSSSLSSSSVLRDGSLNDLRLPRTLLAHIFSFGLYECRSQYASITSPIPFVTPPNIISVCPHWHNVARDDALVTFIIYPEDISDVRIHRQQYVGHLVAPLYYFKRIYHVQFYFGLHQGIVDTLEPLLIEPLTSVRVLTICTVSLIPISTRWSPSTIVNLLQHFPRATRIQTDALPGTHLWCTIEGIMLLRMTSLDISTVNITTPSELESLSTSSSSKSIGAPLPPRMSRGSLAVARVTRELDVLHDRLKQYRLNNSSFDRCTKCQRLRCLPKCSLLDDCFTRLCIDCAPRDHCTYSTKVQNMVNVPATGFANGEIPSLLLTKCNNNQLSYTDNNSSQWTCRRCHSHCCLLTLTHTQHDTSDGICSKCTLAS
jgi:hypothetical protein